MRPDTGPVEAQTALACRRFDRRIPDRGKREEQTGAWNTPRDQGETAVKWRFSTACAHMKPARRDPQVG